MRVMLSVILAACSTRTNDPLPPSGGTQVSALHSANTGEDTRTYNELPEEESVVSPDAGAATGVNGDLLGTLYFTIISFVRSEREEERELGWRMFATAYITAGTANIPDCRTASRVLGGQAWFQDRLALDEEAGNVNLAQAASEARHILHVFSPLPEVRWGIVEY